MRRVIAVVASCLLLSACGSEPPAEPRAETHPHAGATTLRADQQAATVLAPYTEKDAPDFSWGDKLFHFLDERGHVVDAAPWTACLAHGCWDGAPGLAGELPKVGAPDALYFSFDYPGWSFRDVSFNPIEEKCRARVITVEATQVSDGVYRIDPAGSPGRWRIDVFGRGPEGDAVTSVVWDTTAAGTKGERASGVASVLAGHDGRLDSYGVELSLTRLDRAYDDATASVTVTSRSGRSVTIRPHGPSRDCGRVGELFLTAPEDQGRRATRLGAGPYTYTAKVRLGDTTYVGTGTYPDDLIKGNEPNIRLTWDPPLPSYAD